MLICILEPRFTFMQVLFEVTSAVNTVGVTTGITTQLGTAARCVIIVSMYVGRLGPLSVASLWADDMTRSFSFSEESFTVG